MPSLLQTQPGAQPRIVFVPGQNPKPPEAEHRQQLWRCMLAGVRRVDGRAADWLEAHPQLFTLAGWNELFYGRSVPMQESVADIDTLLALPGDWPARLARPTSRQRRRLTMMFAVGDWLPFLIDRVPDEQVKNTMQEALRYFENHAGQAEQVRALVRSALLAALAGGGPLMVIGHSLGSVVAFDTLWESSHVYGDPWRVDRFITLGSPLGTRFVRGRRLGAGHVGPAAYPLGISQWVNVSASGDHISLSRNMAEDYAPMLKMGLVDKITDHVRNIHNPYHEGPLWNPHRSYGYLVHPVTGSEIASWLSGHVAILATDREAGASSA